MNKKMFKLQEWLMMNYFGFEVVVDGPHIQITIDGNFIVENNPDDIISVSINKLKPITVLETTRIPKVKKLILLAFKNTNV